MRVCGKPASFDFLTAVRPQKDQECPQGYAACIKESEPKDSTICVPRESRNGESFASRCPITEVKIRPKSEYPLWAQVIQIDDASSAQVANSSST